MKILNKFLCVFGHNWDIGEVSFNENVLLRKWILIEIKCKRCPKSKVFQIHPDIIKVNDGILVGDY